MSTHDEATAPAQRVLNPRVRPHGFSIAGLVFAVTTAGMALSASLTELAVPLVLALVFSGIGYRQSLLRHGRSDALARCGLALPLAIMAVQGTLQVVLS